MPGGAIVQEHMVETNPMLVADSYVKVFTGDDELADEIDDCFALDINKMFPEEQAEALKKEVGSAVWQAVRIPSLVGRVCDGGTTSRWSAMQIGMSMISAYNQCAGEGATGDFAYASKHRSCKHGYLLTCKKSKSCKWSRDSIRIHGRYFTGSRTNPDDPVRSSLEVVH